MKIINLTKESFVEKVADYPDFVTQIRVVL